MLRPLGRRLIGLCLVVCLVVFLPVMVFGVSHESSLPDGVCGSPQTMLEASQMGRAMVQQVFVTGMPWGEKSLNEYINRLGQNLARSSGSQQVFAFYVVYNPQVNRSSSQEKVRASLSALESV
jgi:predicted Zn-dependent protease